MPDDGARLLSMMLTSEPPLRLDFAAIEGRARKLGRARIRRFQIVGFSAVVVLLVCTVLVILAVDDRPATVRSGGSVQVVGKWRLEYIDSTNPSSNISAADLNALDYHPTAIFESDGKFAVKRSVCGMSSGNYAVDGNTLKLSDSVTTSTGCGYVSDSLKELAERSGAALMAVYLGDTVNVSQASSNVLEVRSRDGRTSARYLLDRE